MERLLILGGTNFIGRVLVEKLLSSKQYDITLFNRGKRNVGIFPDIPQIQGDRETDDYKKIAEQHWDYIIDCSGYYPLSFEKLLQSLKGKVKRYVFVSTISVFDFGGIIGKEVTEDEPLLICSEEQKTSPLPDAYGEKKAEMERILLQQDWLDKIILRPSLVYGKYDFTDRFYYWLWRAKFAAEIMLPDEGRDITSITYVDDLADLLISSLKLEKHNTVYNAATHQVTLKALVETCAEQLELTPQLTSIPAKQLEDAGIQHWQDIALWLNGDMKISLDKVKRDFNTDFTPFADTVWDTIAYYNDLGWPECKYGMKLEKEKQLVPIN